MAARNQSEAQILEQIKKFEDDDKEFLAKHSNILFKTSYKTYGGEKQVIDVPRHNGHDGRFTDHLLHATMYKNHSLNTTCDRDRWLEGSKDWMEHLN